MIIVIKKDKKNRLAKSFIAIGATIKGIGAIAKGIGKSGVNIKGGVQDTLGGVADAINASAKYSKLDPAITDANAREIEDVAAHTAADPLDYDSVYDSMSTLTLSTPMHWKEIYRQAKLNTGGGAGITSDIMRAGAGSKSLLGSGFKMLATGIGAGIGRAKLKNQAKEVGAELARTSTVSNNIATSRSVAQAGAADSFADYSKRANYTWAEGGALNLGYPNDMSSSVFNVFNNGGTHEENPYGGIPQGIASDGLPNLVEEGEVKIKPGLSELLNDYIFSNRSKVDKELIAKYPKYKGKTYAAIAKNILKEYDSNPNNEIIKNTTRSLLEDLYYSQEMGRRKKQLKGENRLMSYGGHLYDSTYDIDNRYVDYLDTYDYDTLAENPVPVSTPITPYALKENEMHLVPRQETFSQEGTIPSHEISAEKWGTLGLSMDDLKSLGYDVTPNYKRKKITGYTVKDNQGLLKHDLVVPTGVRRFDEDILKETLKETPRIPYDDSEARRRLADTLSALDDLKDYVSPLSALGASVAAAFSPNTTSDIPNLGVPIPTTRVRSVENIPRQVVHDRQRQATRGLAQLNAAISNIQNSGANPYAKQALLQGALASGITSLGDMYQKAIEQDAALRFKRDELLGNYDLTSAKLADEAEAVRMSAGLKEAARKDETSLMKRKLDMISDESKGKALSSTLTSMLDNEHAIRKEQVAKEIGRAHV